MIHFILYSSHKYFQFVKFDNLIMNMNNMQGLEVSLKKAGVG